VLRAQQFAEDSGPLAHPVRPRQYREINNFYTATVYEKGAEVIRMLKTLIGDDAFRRGMNLYFDRYDGTAATIEEFLGCFAEASGRDLGHFAQWYEQAGTPTVNARGHYDAEAKTYRLALTQATPPTPGQPEKSPQLIPISLGLVGQSGAEIALSPAATAGHMPGVFVLDGPSATLTFTDVPERPVPSLLRGFSAPVRLEIDLEEDDLLVLFRHDSDPFNQWQSAQTVATRAILRAVGAEAPPAHDRRMADALRHFLAMRAGSDPAFAAAVVGRPTASDIAGGNGPCVGRDADNVARRSMKDEVGTAGAEDLGELGG